MIAHSDPSAIAGAVMVVSFFMMVAFLGWVGAKYGVRCPDPEAHTRRNHTPPQQNNP